MQVKITRFEEELHRAHPRDTAYLDSMLSRFNKGIQASGLFKELKSREFYVKPSTEKSKKKQNKRIKAKQESNALRKKEIQRDFRQRYRTTGGRSGFNKG